MDYLWIFVAIFAAALQTFRSAFQKRMIPEIGKFGATYIRFIYALPFTFLIFIFWFYILDNLIPELNEKAILYCFTGALCQVLFTLLLMIIFSYRNFAAGIAFSKTEVLFAALIETFFLLSILSLSPIKEDNPLPSPFFDLNGLIMLHSPLVYLGLKILL